MDTNSILARVAAGFAVRAFAIVAAIYVGYRVYAFVRHTFEAANAAMAVAL